jgi:hypothetical protein
MDLESIVEFLNIFTPIFATGYFALHLAFQAGGPGGFAWVYGILLATACCFLEAAS